MYHNAHPKPPKREKKSPQPLRRTAIKKKFKASGEKLFFDCIARARAHRCQICGDPINGELVAGNFAHILPKSHYGKWRLNPKNILIACFSINGDKCHNLFDCEAESVLMKRDPDMWRPVFELKELLKVQYNKKSPSKPKNKYAFPFTPPISPKGQF